MESESLILARFLLAKLYKEVISLQPNPFLIRQELIKLPEGLEEIYQSSLNRIQKLPLPTSKVAKRFLSWVTYAIKPITMPVLQCAMAIDPSDTDFIQQKLMDPSHLQSMCIGLVKVDEETGIVSLFRKVSTMWFKLLLTIVDR